MASDTLLVEIRCEELPPAQVAALAVRFPTDLLTALRHAGFAGKDSALMEDNDSDSYGVSDGTPLRLATPRRFAALLTNITAAAATTTVCRRGPARMACYTEDGEETKALRGFLHAVGAESADELITVSEKGREYIAYNETRGGDTLSDSLANIVEQVLLSVNAPRLMRWGDNAFKFIRPLRGALMQHGEQVLGGSVLGVTAGDTSRGHPTLALDAIKIDITANYRRHLKKEGHVIADINDRRTLIASALQPNYTTSMLDAAKLTDLCDKLLNEVTAMCEMPAVYHGEIDASFLNIPAFCIEECMVKHQRAFPHYENGSITTRYFFIADNRPQNPAGMISGFNTVLRARLRDVEFYLNEDRKLTLADALEKLNNITYHRALGSQRARVQRIAAIAAAIGKRLQLTAAQSKQLQQAAKICKSDLPTLMISEYPTLEGQMAAEYFCQDDPTIARLVQSQNIKWNAIKNYFESTPKEIPVMQALMLAVQLEKLIGMFAAGETPSGSKDPHGLRAAAAAAAGIISEHGDALPLDAVLNDAAAAFADVPTLAAIDVTDTRAFIIERKRQALLDAGVAANVVNAVLARPQPVLAEMDKKATALADFLTRPEAAELIEAHKRVNNILRKANFKDGAATTDNTLLSEAAEKNLFKQLQKMNTAQPYDRILADTAALRDSINTFFDEVLVNADDAAVRQNRLALLGDLRTFFNTVGDLSKLSGG